MISLEDAIIFATKAHAGQKDKLGHPYILHPLRVMMAFKYHEFDERIVGVFHDILEDTPTTVSDLLALGISQEQSIAIQLLTHSEHMPREQYVKIIKTNALATRVKIIDILDNLSRIEYLPIETQNRLRSKYAKDLEILYV